MADPASAPRRRRSTVESIGSILLGFEAFVVFFATLLAAAIWPEPHWAWIGGPALILLLLAIAAQLRHRWAVWAGWALQLLLIALGAVVPTMFVVGAIFAGMWAYAIIKAEAIDRDRAAQAAAPPSADPKEEQ